MADVQDGEILVAPLTAPSWAPIFRRIAGTVTDSGGMMSHAAIVCREYGLPAVTGTAFATQGDQDRPARASRRQQRRRHHPRRRDQVFFSRFLVVWAKNLEKKARRAVGPVRRW